MRIFNHIYFFPVNSIACLRINHVQINLFKLVLKDEEVLYVVGLIVNDAFAEEFAHNRRFCMFWLQEFIISFSAMREACFYKFLKSFFDVL